MAYAHQEKRKNRLGMSLSKKGTGTSKSAISREEVSTVWLSELPSERLTVGSAEP